MNLDSFIYHGGMITVLGVVPVVSCLLFHTPTKRYVFSLIVGSLLAWAFYLWQYMRANSLSAGEETDALVLFSQMLVSAFQLFLWYSIAIIVLTMIFNWWHKDQDRVQEKSTATGP